MTSKSSSHWAWALVFVILFVTLIDDKAVFHAVVNYINAAAAQEHCAREVYP